ncbi:MAG: endonuclease III [Chlamydiae bacterium]|nr:endonuclease III [Chlamydiota bacterium]
MTPKQKALLITTQLDRLFPSPSIPLTHEDPFTLLVAVLLSAQCTDVRVNQVTPLLFAKAKTPWTMIQLSQEELESIVRPCGLYKQKSRALLGLSHMLIERFQGEVPSSLEALESLPGVGHKTASVVMIQAFGKPAFPVDTHIHRCAKRWGLSRGKNVKQTELDLQKLFPKTTWAKIHLQMIYYARSFCPARGHREQDCPICSMIKE